MTKREQELRAKYEAIAAQAEDAHKAVYAEASKNEFDLSRDWATAYGIWTSLKYEAAVAKRAWLDER